MADVITAAATGPRRATSVFSWLRSRAATTRPPSSNANPNSEKEQEVIRPGDLFYLPPGHTGLVEEDFECVEFSRPAEHEPVMDVIRHNAAPQPLEHCSDGTRRDSTTSLHNDEPDRD